MSVSILATVVESNPDWFQEVKPKRVLVIEIDVTNGHQVNDLPPKIRFGGSIRVDST